MSRDTFHAVLFTIVLIGVVVIGIKFNPTLTVTAQTQAPYALNGKPCKEVAVENSHTFFNCDGVTKALEEIPPYKFAEVDKDTMVYKGVHEGCEYFVATSVGLWAANSRNKSVSIALGRGCK